MTAMRAAPHNGHRSKRDHSNVEQARCQQRAVVRTKCETLSTGPFADRRPTASLPRDAGLRPAGHRTHFTSSCAQSCGDCMVSKGPSLPHAPDRGAGPRAGRVGAGRTPLHPLRAISSRIRRYCRYRVRETLARGLSSRQGR